MIESFTVQVPSSTANLGSGFDTVSAALSLRLFLQVEPFEGDVVEWVQGSDTISIPPAGTIWSRRLWTKPWNSWGQRVVGCESTCAIRFLSRGAWAAVRGHCAGVKIAERISEVSLDAQQIFDLALPLEGHPDNLAASLLGGWVLSRVTNGRMAG